MANIILDENGVLDCFVQQQQTSNLELGIENASYEETWKGPKTKVLAIQDGGLNLYGAKFALDKVRPDVSSNASFISEFTVPTFPNTDYAWVIDDISIDDSDSGDLVLVKIRYRAQNTTGGGWEGTEPADSFKVVRWKLSWGDRGATCLAYLDPEKYGARQKGYVIDTTMIDTDKYPQNGLVKTVPALKGFSNRSAQSEKYTSNEYQFVKGVAVYEIATDNDDLKKLADYYAAGLKPQLHYPILTRTTTSNRSVKSIDGTTTLTRPWQEGDTAGIKETYDKKKNIKTIKKTTINTQDNTTTIETTIESVVGVDIDKICQLEDVPFRFDKEYEWLKVADDIVQTQNGYERNEVWWGDFEWTEEFYGADAWELGTIGV